MAEEMRTQQDHLRYDPELRSLLLSTGGRELSVTGLTPEVAFQRVPKDGPAQWALFATAEELGVLAKMVGYVLDRVKISEASRTALAALLPRVEALQETARSSSAAQ